MAAVTEHVVSVEDHGIWRGHRTWTIRIDGPTGPAQVSATDCLTERKAIAQALKTYRARRVWTDAERAAMGRNGAALGNLRR